MWQLFGMPSIQKRVLYKKCEAFLKQSITTFYSIAKVYTFTSHAERSEKEQPKHLLCLCEQCIQTQMCAQYAHYKFNSCFAHSIVFTHTDPLVNNGVYGSVSGCRVVYAQAIKICCYCGLFFLRFLRNSNSLKPFKCVNFEQTIDFCEWLSNRLCQRSVTVLHVTNN